MNYMEVRHQTQAEGLRTQQANTSDLPNHYHHQQRAYFTSSVEAPYLQNLKTSTLSVLPEACQSARRIQSSSNSIKSQHYDNETSQSGVRSASNNIQINNSLVKENTTTINSPKNNINSSSSSSTKGGKSKFANLIGKSVNTVTSILTAPSPTSASPHTLDQSKEASRFEYDLESVSETKNSSNHHHHHNQQQDSTFLHSHKMQKEKMATSPPKMKESTPPSEAVIASNNDAKKSKFKRSFLNSLIHSKSKSFSAKLNSSQPHLTQPTGKASATGGGQQALALSTSLPPSQHAAHSKLMKQTSSLEMKIKSKLKKQLSTTLDVEKVAAMASPITPIIDNESANDNASNVSSNDTIKPSLDDNFSDIYPVSLSSAASSNLSIIEASKMKKKIFSKPIKTAFVKGASFSSTSMSSSPPSSPPLPTPMTTTTSSSNYISNINKYGSGSNPSKLSSRPVKTLSIDSHSNMHPNEFNKRVSHRLLQNGFDDTENSENCDDDEEEEEESVGSNEEIRRKNMHQILNTHPVHSSHHSTQQPSPMQTRHQPPLGQNRPSSSLRKRSRSRSKSRLVHSLNSKAAAGVCAASNAWSLNTDYDEEDFMDAFKVFDENGDGRITAKELNHVLKELGIKMSKQDIKKMIKELDNDGNGTIEYSEFVQMMTTPASRDTDEFELREAFKCIDLDGNGYISREELKDAVKKIMSTDSKISVQDVEEMMTEADIDGNGLIDFDEFVRVLVEKRN